MNSKTLHAIKCIHRNYQEFSRAQFSNYEEKKISDYLFIMYGRAYGSTDKFNLHRVEIFCFDRLALVGSTYTFYKVDGIGMSFGGCWMQKSFQCLMGESLEGELYAKIMESVDIAKANKLKSLLNKHG